MLINKQYNKFCKLSLLFYCFFILSGFEFETMKNELSSAEKLISEKKYSEAEEALTSIINNLKAVEEASTDKEKVAKNLFTPQVYYRLGEIQYKQNKFENAIKYFYNIIIYEYPSALNIQAYYYTGMSNFHLKKYGEARGMFTRLVDEYKDMSEAAEGQYYIGICYELEKNTEEAKTAFRKFLNLYPSHPWSSKVREKLGGK